MRVLGSPRPASCAPADLDAHNSQVLIVQYGGRWFATVPLDGPQWALCTGLGATSLLLREAIRHLPSSGGASFWSRRAEERQ